MASWGKGSQWRRECVCLSYYCENQSWYSRYLDSEKGGLILEMIGYCYYLLRWRL